MTLGQGGISQLLSASCPHTAPGAEGLDGCTCTKRLWSYLRTRGGLSWHKHRLSGVRSVLSLLHTEERTPFLVGEEKISLQTDCPFTAPSKVACITHGYQQQKAATASSRHSQHQSGSGFMFHGDLDSTEKTSLEKRKEKALARKEQDHCQGRGATKGSVSDWRG